MSETDITQILERLDGILFWLKIAHLQEARKYFESILSSDRKKQVYQLTNGENSINAIMEKTGIKSKSQIPDWWDEWSKKGLLVESPKYKGRKVRVVDLRDLGIYE